jgi:NTE family protein
MAKIALYLAGGGARGAYQAGVLKAINTILNPKKIPFDILSGASIGSVNAAVLAEHASDFSAGTNKLHELWDKVACHNIFKANNYALSKSFIANMSSIFFKQRLLGYILDTTPLRAFIKNNLNFLAIEDAIKNQHLNTFEILSNCYETRKTISFYQHDEKDFEDWNYPLHKSQRVNWHEQYFMASTSLPLFFPPVKIDGLHYGDGHVGLEAPLRGAISFQADKILIIGTRQIPNLTIQKNVSNGDIDFSRVLGGLVNGLFLDNIERDVEMVNNMNNMAGLLSNSGVLHTLWRPIEILHLRPSVEISSIAQSQYNSLPILLCIMLNFLGAKRHSGDLLSFLLFEKKFTRELIRLGFDDTIAAEESILNFFEA